MTFSDPLGFVGGLLEGTDPPDPFSNRKLCVTDCEMVCIDRGPGAVQGSYLIGVRIPW